MNISIVSGNLGKNPESFFTAEGTHIVSFPSGIQIRQR